MKMNRRRFLSISAAAAVMPKRAAAETWQGRAFGGDISLTIRAPKDTATAALEMAQTLIADVEGLFSLYDPTSTLSQLNITGILNGPEPHFTKLLTAADTAHHMTGGRFDPTVQPLWTALANGDDVAAATVAIGWDRVYFDPQKVVLENGQALTFNGIAQGYATDLITDAFQALALTDVLVNIGEYRVVGGPWRLGIADSRQGILGYQTLTDGAVATSSPAALSLGQDAHILHPNWQARWATVSVTAANATLADSLSTALCLADRDLIAEVSQHPDVHTIRLVDFTGDLITV